MRAISFTSLDFIRCLSPPPGIQGPKTQHSQGEGIQQQQLFIPPVSNSRRGAGPQAHLPELPSGQYSEEPRDVTAGGTSSHLLPPHRLLPATEHFSAHPSWDPTSHQLLLSPPLLLSQWGPEPQPPLLPALALRRETVPLKNEAGQSTYCATEHVGATQTTAHFPCGDLGTELAAG